MERTFANACVVLSIGEISVLQHVRMGKHELVILVGKVEAVTNPDEKRLYKERLLQEGTSHGRDIAHENSVEGLEPDTFYQKSVP